MKIWQRISSFVSSVFKSGQNGAGIKLWVDSQKNAPEGWIWVQTYKDAVYVLSLNKVSVCSVGKDLDPVWKGDIIEGCHTGKVLYGCRPPMGYDVVCWMADNEVWPDIILVHAEDPHWARATKEALMAWNPNCKARGGK